MKTIRQLLDCALTTRRGQPYIHTKEQVYTWDETVLRVRAAAATLAKMGLCGAQIAIWGDNSYAWMVCDLAVMGYVGVSVALDRNLTAAAVASAVCAADVRCVLYAAAKEDEIAVVRAACEGVLFVQMESMAEASDCAAAESLPEKEPDACSKIVFSSGTTSSPKAVMLSQRNMLFGFDLLMRRAPMDETDLCYLFLPLHHTYAGLCNFLYTLRSGMQIYLCSDLHTMTDEIAAVRPTVLSVVPLTLERIYHALPESLRAAEELTAEQSASVRQLFGGRLRYLFSGGVKLDPEIKRFFHRAGINLLEAYALTETASIFSIEYSGSRDADSVGTVFESLEVRVRDADENGVGELCVRGEPVFLGYYRNEAATAQAFDTDGYFRTGDLGRVTQDGTLYLRGRKRRVILRSNGENIYPDALESRICALCASVSRAKVYACGSVICAVLYSSGPLDAEWVIGQLNAELPPFSHITQWEVIMDAPGARMK